MFPGTGQQGVVQIRRKRSERGNSQDQSREVCSACPVGHVGVCSVWVQFLNVCRGVNGVK